MLSRVIAFFVAFVAVSPIYAQEVFVNGLQKIPSNGTGGDVESAWLDLRQTPVANSKQQAPLGLGVNLPTSESVMVPMVGVSTIDIEVPGDGKTIRGAYLDWMTSAEVLHPMSAEQRDLIPEPFANVSPLHASNQDKEMFGTVTATLADETIRIGASVEQGAAFQFGIEA